ncbi:MAG: TonB-dependent receptor, partial [Pseudomonadota bacterium]
RDTGAPAQSGMRRHQAGFRLDTELGGAGAVLQGDAYRASLHNPGTRDTDLAGANLLGRLSQPLGEDGELRVQAYLDYTARDQANSINEHLSTVDLDLQHSLRLAPSAYLVWGGGHRIARDRVANPLTLAFLPANRDLVWTNLFVQGEWTPWTPLRLVGGLRAERNSYSGIGHLPYASVAFQAAPEQTWWASLARALRAPSRIDRDFYAPANGLPRYLLAGGPDFVSEVARVAQLGYRGQLARRLSVAATAFYSHYDLLRTIEYDARGAAVFRNNGAGSARGLELSASWELAANWRLTGGATAQRLQVGSKPGSKDLSTGGLVGGDPRSWSMLRSSYDWSETVDLDATLRHVGALPAPAVASYTVLDARIGWRVRPDLALSLQALNLGAPAHPEFGAASTPTRPGRSLFGPTLYGQLIWRF